MQQCYSNSKQTRTQVSHTAQYPVLIAQYSTAIYIIPLMIFFGSSETTQVEQLTRHPNFLSTIVVCTTIIEVKTDILNFVAKYHFINIIIIPNICRPMKNTLLFPLKEGESGGCTYKKRRERRTHLLLLL